MKLIPSFLLLLAAFVWEPTMQAGSAPKRVKNHRELSPAERVEQNRPDPLPVKSNAGKRSNVLMVDLSNPVRVNTRYREGIDVSRYQGVIDWERVAKEGQISYAYMKATEGAQLVDRTYAYNIKSARQAGLSVGSYHFYRPNVSIDEQFLNLTANVLKEDQDLVPMIDIETAGNVSNERLVSDLKTFLRWVTEHYGKKPLLYTYQNFYNKHLVGRISGYQWMIAKYQAEVPVLTDDLDYMMWQYTQTGRVPGVKGNVDRSCLMGTHSLSQIQM